MAYLAKVLAAIAGLWRSKQCDGWQSARFYDRPPYNNAERWK